VGFRSPHLPHTVVTHPVPSTRGTLNTLSLLPPPSLLLLICITYVFCLSTLSHKYVAHAWKVGFLKEISLFHNYKTFQNS
jgi:hypothetical protein